MPPLTGSPPPKLSLRDENESTTISSALGNPMTPVIYVAAILAIFIVLFVSWWYWCRKKPPEQRSLDGMPPNDDMDELPQNLKPAGMSRRSKAPAMSKNVINSDGGALVEEDEEGDNLVHAGPDPELGKSAPIVAVPSLPSLTKSADAVELNGIASSRYPTLGRPSSRGLPNSVGNVASGAIMARCRANKQLFEEAKKQKKFWAIPQKPKVSYTSVISPQLKASSMRSTNKMVQSQRLGAKRGTNLPKSNLSNIGSKGLKFNWKNVLEVSHVDGGGGGGGETPGAAPFSTVSNAGGGQSKPKKLKSPQIDPKLSEDKTAAAATSHAHNKKHSKSKSRSKSKTGANLKQNSKQQQSNQNYRSKSKIQTNSKMKSKSKSKSKSRIKSQSKSKIQTKTKSKLNTNSKSKSKLKTQSKSKSRSKTAQSKSRSKIAQSKSRSKTAHSKSRSNSKSKNKIRSKSGIKSDISNSQGQVRGKSRSKSRSKEKPNSKPSRPAMSTLLNKSNNKNMGQKMRSPGLALIKDIVTK